MILVLEWNGMETTLYPQGKIMFYPLEDRDLCIRYASDILNRISGGPPPLLNMKGYPVRGTDHRDRGGPSAVRLPLSAFVQIRSSDRQRRLRLLLRGGRGGSVGSLSWLIILLAFTVAGFLETRIGSREEGEGGGGGSAGERDHRNILGVGIPPCIVALASSSSGTVTTC